MTAFSKTARVVPVEEPSSNPSEFAVDLVAGLAASPKRIAPKYFYDEAGSRLFDRITELPEYYPTRTEVQILADHVDDLARHVPEGAGLVDFGSGSSAKVRPLLRAFTSLFAYVPVDISADYLREEAARLAREFPALEVEPVAADLMRPFALPPSLRGRPRAGFFPGSTIGNFEPREAKVFLRHAAGILGPGAALIIGVDLVKAEAILNAAYNDEAGITAQFNLNLLVRANRELGADFDLDAFEHRAFYNPAASRIEMHLLSRTAQTVRVCGTRNHFAAGETIHTENSYKYTVEGFATLAADGGWTSAAVYCDPASLFSVHVLRAAERAGP